MNVGQLLVAFSYNSRYKVIGDSFSSHPSTKYKHSHGNALKYADYTVQKLDWHDDANNNPRINIYVSDTQDASREQLTLDDFIQIDFPDSISFDYDPDKKLIDEIKITNREVAIY